MHSERPYCNNNNPQQQPNPSKEMDPDAASIVRPLVMSEHAAASHEAHVQLFALARVSKDWQRSAQQCRENPGWNKTYLDEAAALLTHIQTVDRAHPRADAACYTRIVHGLRHLQVLKDENLQRQGIGALHALCYGSNDPWHTSKIFAVGGLEVVIGAMVMHPTCLPLNQECCRMITSMADWRGHTQCAWSARHSNTAVRVLVDAIRRFPLDVRMHTSAVQCLTKLSTMDNVETEEAETILPQIWECRRAILERGGLKAALLGPVGESVCLLLQVFAEFKGFEDGRWQEVAGQDCIRIVVDALRSSVVHMRMITQDNIIPSSDLKHTHASTMLLAKLCQNAFNAGQVVAAGSTIVFLQVLAALRLLNTQLQVDFMDLTCPQIVICVCEALRNTVSIDGQQHHDIVLDAIRGIIRNTSNDQVRVAGCAVFGGFAQIDSTHTIFLQASGALRVLGDVILAEHASHDAINEACCALVVLTRLPGRCYKIPMQELSLLPALHHHLHLLSLVDGYDTTRGYQNCHHLIKWLSAP